MLAELKEWSLLKYLKETYEGGATTIQPGMLDNKAEK
jgi:hypothetical protein